MTNQFPRAQIILDYETFYGESPPENRIQIIKQISKENILYEIAGLNYRLKPKDRIQIDKTFVTQIKELEYFTQTPEHYNKYVETVRKYTKSKNEYPIIFNRPACLFALEEIIASEEIVNIEDFSMNKVENWDNLIKYLLAVNYAITQIKKEKNISGIDLETLNPKLLALNELTIEIDPIFTPYRGYFLIDYFSEKSVFRNEIVSYFSKTYGISPNRFIFHLLGMYITNSSPNPEHNFYYLIRDGAESLFNKLSSRQPKNDPIKLIDIRKSPFIKVGRLEFLLSDNSFLLEKSYSQFLNDFWFDWIKHQKDENGKPKYSIEFYRSEFGYFFEDYLSKILFKCFSNYKYSVFKSFNQLKITTKQGDIEIADIYLRYNKKILLGQVKSSSIYDKEKFGGSTEILYKKSRNDFFNNFGVNQVVESILRLENFILNVDNKFPIGKSYEIYPCIVFNEKALQTPLMADIFNTRFQELIKPLKKKKILIRPLCLIHINDFERLEDSLSKNPREIWDLLRYNQKDSKFIPPFYSTINENWKEKEYPKRILELYKDLILRFNPGEKTAGNSKS